MAIEKYGYINVLVNSAGIYASKQCIADDGQTHSLELFEEAIKV